jgi:hypothetical protein
MSGVWILALLQSAAPAASAVTAPPEPSAEVLWQNVTVGMTREQVQAAQPSRQVSLGEGCFARLTWTYERRQVQRLTMTNTSNDTRENCPAVITQAMRDRYGEPLDAVTETRRNDCGNPYARGIAGTLAQICRSSGGETPYEVTTRAWRTGNVTILLTRESNAPTKWSLVYRYTEPADTPAVGDKL